MIYRQLSEHLDYHSVDLVTYEYPTVFQMLKLVFSLFVGMTHIRRIGSSWTNFCQSALKNNRPEHYMSIITIQTCNYIRRIK